MPRAYTLSRGRASFGPSDRTAMCIAAPKGAVAIHKCECLSQEADVSNKPQTIPDSDPESAVQWLRQARYVTVLTGAGVSAESGVPTFRGGGGLWEGYRIEDVASPEGFARNPRLVWEFYNGRRARLAQVQPNAGHIALATMEKHLGRQRFALVTQNVDGLHQRAGSTDVIELHGSLLRTRCTGCGRCEDRNFETLPDLPRCQHCGALLRPDVVWFHEMLPADAWERAEQATRRADLFFSIGTSAVVYPAAALIYLAHERGARVIEINIERTEASAVADLGFYAPSGQVLPLLIERAFGTAADMKAPNQTEAQP